MRRRFRLLFLFIAILFSQTGTASSSSNLPFFQDTIPQNISVAKKYKGNRIEVRSINVKKKKGKSYSITYKLSNSGRNKIKLGKGKNIPEDLIINFDKSLDDAGLTNAKEIIIEKILKEKISLRPGQLILGNKMKFNFKDIPPTDRIAEVKKEVISVEEKEIVEIEKEEVANISTQESEVLTNITSSTISDSVSNEKIEIAKIDSNEKNQEVVDEEKIETTETKTIEVVQKEMVTPVAELSPIVFLLPIPNAIFQINHRMIATEEYLSQFDNIEEEVVAEMDSTQKSMIVDVRVPFKISTEEIIKEETIAEVVESQTTIEEDTIVETVDETTIVKVDSSEYTQIVETEVNKVEVILDTLSTEIPSVVEVDNVAIEYEKTEKLCGDLVIDSIEILKKNKKAIVAKFTITNNGNAPVNIYGESKKDEDNITISAHFTRSNKITRGAIPVKLFPIKKGLKSQKGILKPGESFSQKLKIDTYKLSKFTPMLALSVDPLLMSNECSRLNNVAFVKIKEDAAPSAEGKLPVRPAIDPNEVKISGTNLIKEKEEE